MSAMTDEPPWLRVESEGIFGRWHMPAGGGPGFVLTAYDLRLREVGAIPANQRCEVCQGVTWQRTSIETRWTPISATC